MNFSITKVVSSLYDSQKKSSYLELNKKRNHYAKLTHKVTTMKSVVRRKMSIIKHLCSEDSYDETHENSCLLLWVEIDELEDEIHKIKNDLKHFK